MELVKAFNAELTSLYDQKPPISKVKMTSLTKGAIRAIKFYKHVVQSVEKFLQKCRTEYKVPGLYVIDSIVRQSRHQFGVDRDVFAPRFAKNLQLTFYHIFKCPPEDKSKVIRVLNLWQKNQVFQPDVIQPIFDLADPDSGATRAIEQQQEAKQQQQVQPPAGAQQQQQQQVQPSAAAPAANSAQPASPFGTNSFSHDTNSSQNNRQLDDPASQTQVDPNLIQKLQQLQSILAQPNSSSQEQSAVKLGQRLPEEMDLGEVEESRQPKPNEPSLESLSALLSNPDVIKQLQGLQQALQTQKTQEHSERERRLRQQEEEFDKQLAQAVGNLPFASEIELQPALTVGSNSGSAAGPEPGDGGLTADTADRDLRQTIDLTDPAAARRAKSPLEEGERENDTDTDDRGRDDRERSRRSSRSRSRSRRHRSRSHSRSRGRKSRRRDRSRSRDRRGRSRSRTRDREQRERERELERQREKEREAEREKERERKKRGLPPVKGEHLGVCSTTLWVGHLSKLVQQEDLSDLFGEYGDVLSIDLIPPRGCAFICMNRRQDAARALLKLKSHKLQGKPITIAWAPGKGMKGKDFKDYWEVEVGCSYIPYTKLTMMSDLDAMEEGGVIDEESVPDWLRGRYEQLHQMDQLPVNAVPPADPSAGYPPQPQPGLLPTPGMQTGLLPTPVHSVQSGLLPTPGAQPPGLMPGPPGTEPPGLLPGPPGSQPSGLLPGPPGSQPPGLLPGPPGSQPSGLIPGPPGGQPSGLLPGPPGSQPSGLLPGPPGTEPPGLLPPPPGLVSAAGQLTLPSEPQSSAVPASQQSLPPPGLMPNVPPPAASSGVALAFAGGRPPMISLPPLGIPPPPLQLGASAQLGQHISAGLPTLSALPPGLAQPQLNTANVTVGSGVSLPSMSVPPPLTMMTSLGQSAPPGLFSLAGQPVVLHRPPPGAAQGEEPMDMDIDQPQISLPPPPDLNGPPPAVSISGAAGAAVHTDNGDLSREEAGRRRPSRWGVGPDEDKERERGRDWERERERSRGREREDSRPRSSDRRGDDGMTEERRFSLAARLTSLANMSASTLPLRERDRSSGGRDRSRERSRDRDRGRDRDRRERHRRGSREHDPGRRRSRWGDDERRSRDRERGGRDARSRDRNRDRSRSRERDRTSPGDSRDSDRDQRPSREDQEKPEAAPSRWKRVDGVPDAAVPAVPAGGVLDLLTDAAAAAKSADQPEPDAEAEAAAEPVSAEQPAESAAAAVEAGETAAETDPAAAAAAAVMVADGVEVQSEPRVDLEQPEERERGFREPEDDRPDGRGFPPPYHGRDDFPPDFEPRGPPGHFRGRGGPRFPPHPPDLHGPPDMRGPPDRHGPPDMRGPMDRHGPPDRRGPPDMHGPPDMRGPRDMRGPPDMHGPPDMRGPPDMHGMELEEFGEYDEYEDDLPPPHEDFLPRRPGGFGPRRPPPPGMMGPMRPPFRGMRMPMRGPLGPRMRPPGPWMEGGRGPRWLGPPGPDWGGPRGRGRLRAPLDEMDMEP